MHTHTGVTACRQDKSLMLIYIISNRLQPHISDPHSSYNPQSNSSNLVVLILISLSRPSQRHQLAPRKPWYLKRISDLDESFDSKLIVSPIRWIKKKERKKERKNGGLGAVEICLMMWEQSFSPASSLMSALSAATTTNTLSHYGLSAKISSWVWHIFEKHKYLQ